MKQMRQTFLLFSALFFMASAQAENFEAIYTGSKPLPSDTQLGMDRYLLSGNVIKDERLYRRLRAMGYTDWNFPNVIQAGREHRRLKAEQEEYFRRFGGNMHDSARGGLKYGYGKYGVLAPVTALAGALGALSSEGVEASEVREPTNESGLADSALQSGGEPRNIQPQSSGASRFARPTKSEGKKVDQRR